MKKTKYGIIFLMIILFISIIPSFSKAATVSVGTVKGVKIVDKDTNYLKISWKKATNATGYNIYVYNKSTKKYEKIGSTTNRKYTLNNLKSAKEYKIKVRGYKKIGNKKYFGEYSSIKITATEPKQVKNLKVTNQSDDTISLSWDKVTRASGYKIYLYNSSTKKYDEKGFSTTNSATIYYLSHSKTYSIKVRAYKVASNNKKYYGKYSNIVTTFTIPEKVSNLYAKSSYIDAITLTWNSMARIAGYRIYQYNSSTKEYEKIANVTKNEFKVTGLNPASEYKFKVRAYMIYNNTKYFGKSSTILDTATLPHKVSDFKVAGVSENHIELKWSSVEKADGYAVYLFSQRSQSFKLYKTTTSTSMKITSLDAAKFYKMYVKSYATINGKNYYSEASKTISKKTNSTETELAGIDVSSHNASINWEKVKKAGVDFAILRCGFGQDYDYQDDDYFGRNVSECERLGIPYGVYLYSYALNTTNASSEADHVLRLLKGHSPQYGVWFDMEDADGYKQRYGMPSNKELVNICITFCEKMIGKGYKTGIYASLSWFNNQLNSSKLDKYEKWVAQWNDKCSYTKDYVMWQYTSSGMVDGISGRVDMNIMYLTISEEPIDPTNPDIPTEPTEPTDPTNP